MKKTIAIIGSGPSALMLAATLDEKLFDITIYERKSTPARKFLVAGDGGFNLTHSEDLELFISRYTPKTFLENSIRSFNNIDLGNWLKSIGIETYIGSSKRVFPIKGIKPIDVLNAILNKLKNKQVRILTEYNWIGWKSNKGLIFEHDKKNLTVKADITVFALGGGSWSITGSDGSWTKLFKEKGVDIIPFQSSNCAFEVKWDKIFIESVEGKSIKNISIACDGFVKKGELVITKFGLEGGAIYALSPQIRKLLKVNNTATIYIDLKPTHTVEVILSKISTKGKKSYTKLLKDELKFSDTIISLLKSTLSKEEFIDFKQLSKKIKQLPLTISGMAPIEEAISTVGGISLNEVDKYYQLKNLPNHYCIGEMLDWDAPTGGYLIQACFSMGNYLGKQLNSVKFP